jgi:hypothetical protein
MLILSPVDWSGRHSTPAGNSGQGETPQEQKRRGGSPDAPRKASACSGNQLSTLKQPIVKGRHWISYMEHRMVQFHRKHVILYNRILFL